jgi:protein gp37
MAQETGISWTNHTFNVVWGCSKVSAGCKRCYAEGIAARAHQDLWGVDKPRRTFGEAYWRQPLMWNRDAKKAGKPARVFCSSMCDVFEDHPTTIAELGKLWPLIRQTPWLQWQLLTKRPERIAASLPGDWGQGYPNVWLGTSIENNEVKDRADHLRVIPARIRFVSYEPALGPIDEVDLTGIHWLIYGGESGSGYRYTKLSWPREIMERCKREGIIFFHKQSEGLFPGTGVKLDGKLYREWPDVQGPSELVAA